MKWIERLTDCIDYIEQNLTGQMDMDALARMACLSRLYFARMFEAVTGQTVAAYIRNRRMTLAIKDLKERDARVLHIALKYGYATSESFNRAFQSVHGIAPSKVKQFKGMLKAYPKLTIKIVLKGEQAMKYRIEEKPAFKVLGPSIVTKNPDEGNSTEIPAFWQRINTDGTSAKLWDYAPPDSVMYGICFEMAPDGSFRYTACVDYKGGETGGFDVFDIPATKWAVFECYGPMPTAIQKVWNQIFIEWFPANDYEMAKGPQVEYYAMGDPSAEDYYTEVWIPIK